MGLFSQSSFLLQVNKEHEQKKRWLTKFTIKQIKVLNHINQRIKHDFNFICFAGLSKLRIWQQKSPKLSSQARFVGVAGFEPATSCSQSRRDDRATLHPDSVNRSANIEGIF